VQGVADRMSVGLDPEDRNTMTGAEETSRDYERDRSAVELKPKVPVLRGGVCTRVRSGGASQRRIRETLTMFLYDKEVALAEL